MSPPSWRASATWFSVAFSLEKQQQPLQPDERTLMQQVLLLFRDRRFALDAFAVLDDEVQALLAPAPGEAVGNLVRGWRTASAFRLHREHARAGRIWQMETVQKLRGRSAHAAARQRIAECPERKWPGLGTYAWAWPSP